MSIIVSDIKRAIIGGGDAGVFTDFWHRAMGNSSVPCLASFSNPVPLPESAGLLKAIASDFETLVRGWIEVNETEPPSKPEANITVLGLPPYGRNVAGYVERVIDEIKPDFITIDLTPLELSSSLLYAFSLPCATGLTRATEIISKESGILYSSPTFYPGNLSETAIIKAWQRKIPLIPAGVPVRKAKYSDIDYMMAFIDENEADREQSKWTIYDAHRALDNGLTDVSDFDSSTKLMKGIFAGFAARISGKLREILVEEGCYIASRTIEAIALSNATGKKPRVLVLTDITRYEDVDYTLGLMLKGVMEEIYFPPEKDSLTSEMVLTGKDTAKDEVIEYVIPKSTLAQRFFQSEFEEEVKLKSDEILSETAADRMISEIAGRTRYHPEIAHGASVRGTIALREVLYGLSQIRSGVTREVIHRAALITLPPRILAKQAGTEEAIIDDISKEVLYDISFTPRADGDTHFDTMKWLSPEDLMDALKNLKPISEDKMKEMSQRRLPAAIVADNAMNRELMKALESKKLLKKGTQDQFSLTQKAIEALMKELEEKLRTGEITPDEYNQQKNRLTQMMKNLAQPKFKMSAKDLANTIMEIMDAQDKQWNSEVSFERLNVYYHIKANTELGEVNTRKRDYYGLKTLIDDLDRQGLLTVTEGTNAEFTLTGEALSVLLDYLISRDPKGRGLKGAAELGKAIVQERKNETRRYSSGDVFRDISVRHTLKEIAKKKKNLTRVTKDDFKVYTKQRRQLQSDIVLCMDVSGSMGFQHKLMYARLAASGLAKAAIENKDRVGVVAFNNTGQTTMTITDRDEDAILDYIVKLSARGNTNIGDGIKVATDLLFEDHSHNQKFLVLITDGEPTAISQRAYDRLKEVKEKDLTEESAIVEARKAAQRGVKISVIHIAANNEASGEFIRNIARIGKGKVRRIASADDIRAIMRQ